MMVHVIEPVKEDPGVVSHTEEKVKDMDLYQLHGMERDTIGKWVG